MNSLAPRIRSGMLLAGCLALLAVLVAAPRSDAAKEAASADAVTLVVTDPLAAPLACPCVKGYAQRDYEKLAKFLEVRLTRPVKVVFSETLAGALSEKKTSRADIIIGKQSMIEFDLTTKSIAARRVAMLTGKDGKTTQTGMFVVPSADPAKSPADLAGYRIIFGPAECDEKHSAALALLAQHGVTPAGELETCGVCSDAAEMILKLDAGKHGAAVISSYAEPLLEGCGKVKKGDLRIIGQTESVPFITVFVDSAVPAELRSKITASLLAVRTDAELCTALETKSGFVAADDSPRTAKKK